MVPTDYDVKETLVGEPCCVMTIHIILEPLVQGSLDASHSPSAHSKVLIVIRVSPANSDECHLSFLW